MSAASTSTATSTFPTSRPTSTPEASPAGAPRLSPLTRLWMWGWIPSFLIHDGEEALFIVRHGGFKEFGVFQTTSQCLTGIFFELMVGWLAVLAATRAARPGRAMALFGVLMWAWTLHGVVHLVEAVSGHGYTFGSVTAGPVVVAYGALMLARLYHEHLLDRRRLPLAILGGAALGELLIFTAHQYGTLLG